MVIYQQSYFRGSILCRLCPIPALVCFSAPRLATLDLIQKEAGGQAAYKYQFLLSSNMKSPPNAGRMFHSSRLPLLISPATDRLGLAWPILLSDHENLNGNACRRVGQERCRELGIFRQKTFEADIDIVVRRGQGERNNQSVPIVVSCCCYARVGINLARKGVVHPSCCASRPEGSSTTKQSFRRGGACALPLYLLPFPL